MKKLNIVFFVTALDSGGIENYLLRFLNENNEGFEKVFVWCKSGQNGILDEAYLDLKNVELIKKKIGYFDLSGLLSLTTFIRKNDIQCVCDFTGSFSGPVLMAAANAKVEKRIVFYRNSREKYRASLLKNLYRKLSEKLILKYSTKILSNSYSALDYFYPNRSRNNEKFKVVYNGIDSKQFEESFKNIQLLESLKIPKRSFIIGHVGRFDSQKNHETIVRVLEKLCDKYDNIYCVLCGKETRENVPTIIKNLNPALHIKFRILGNRDDVKSLLKIMDVFFFPSTIEGQPNALIEAMISNIPIVASNIDPIKETTPSEIHPYLKDPMDVDGFVDIIEKMYLEEEFRKKFILSDWATTQFDYKTRFTEFYNELRS